jgi:uncharacterized membrane protein
LKITFTPNSAGHKIAILVLALFFIAVGLLHFLNPRPFITIVPGWLPFPKTLVFVSGIFEILGGLGLLARSTRHWAGIGLIALLIAVFPANINMAVEHLNFGFIPDWMLWLRLLLQPILAWIVWSLAVRADKRF